MDGGGVIPRIMFPPLSRIPRKIWSGKWQENNIKYLGVRIGRTNDRRKLILLINHLRGNINQSFKGEMQKMGFHIHYPG